MEPTHVLVPLDGSPLSEDALAYALSTFECPVTVLNVVTPLDAGMSEGGVLELDDERMEPARRRADRLIERARSQAAEDREIERAVEAGDPAETILSYAARHDVDHIAIGGHGDDPSGLLERLLGTVATTVVAEAPITVTVVRERADIGVEDGDGDSAGGDANAGGGTDADGDH